MTEIEADFLSSTVHLLHATSAADAAAGSLFSASKYHHIEKPCVALIERINKAVKEIDAIRDDVTKLMTHGYKADKEKTDYRAPFSPLVSLSELLYGKDYQMYRDYYGPGYYQFFCVCRDLGIDTINELRSVPDKAFSPSDTESVADQKWMSKRMLEIRDDILRHYEKE